MFSKAGIIAFCLVVILGSFFVGTYVGQSHADVDSALSIKNKDLEKPTDVDFSLFWKVWNLLDEKYVATHGTSSDPVSDQERVYGAIRGMTEALGDPYTDFFPPQETKDFEQEISGNFEGVGMEVGIKDEVLTVVSPLKGTPAERAGIKAGDKILRIDDTVTSNMSTDAAIKLIKGPKDTPVRLTLQRGSEAPFEVTVIRAVINVPTINTKLRADGIFVIELYSFTATSPNLFRDALREFMLAKSDKLVLDLRGNPGGYLDAAVNMASWFLPQGTVIVRENFGERQKEKVEKSKGYNIFNDNLKMVILINGGSASASEILAGALSEHGVAQLVGTKSFGKGSVQQLINVTPETSLKVTIARWMTPDGVSISNNGIEPDVVVEVTPGDIEAGRDPQMDKAVELLKQR